MRRSTLASTVSVAACGMLLSLGAAAGNDKGNNGNGKGNGTATTDLSGFQEVPVVITTGDAELRLVMNESARTIDYTLTYSGLQADITQAHIHVAQKGVNGAIVLWLCKTAGVQPTDPQVSALTPLCPGARSGTVSGTLRDANALGNTAQQLAAGNLDDAFIAIEHGVAYGNIHTIASPGGELRGQIKAKRHNH